MAYIIAHKLLASQLSPRMSHPTLKCRRSYISQRLMWQYGIRVAFTRPFVNQERSPHNYLKDFHAELPLYLRAGGLIDFLRNWRPSSERLSLPAQYEELTIALYEHDILEYDDVILAQAWLDDLASIGYKFPSLHTHGTYAALRNRGIDNVVAVAGPLASSDNDFRVFADAAKEMRGKSRSVVFVSPKNLPLCENYKSEHTAANSSNSFHILGDCFPVKVRSAEYATCECVYGNLHLTLSQFCYLYFLPTLCHS